MAQDVVSGQGFLEMGGRGTPPGVEIVQPWAYLTAIKKRRGVAGEVGRGKISPIWDFPNGWLSPKFSHIFTANPAMRSVPLLIPANGGEGIDQLGSPASSSNSDLRYYFPSVGSTKL